MAGGEKSGIPKCVAGMVEGAGEIRMKGFIENCIHNVKKKIKKKEVFFMEFSISSHS